MKPSITFEEVLAIIKRPDKWELEKEKANEQQKIQVTEEIDDEFFECDD